MKRFSAIGHLSKISPRYPFTGRDSEECKDIHIPGIYVGGGWITGCGSHPQSAERVKDWKRVSGVLCDRTINMKTNMKVYRTVVRPALMYGAETRALKKAHEKKLEVVQMRMLRWMCGGTKLDKIRNERIIGTPKVGEITKKVQERRIKRCGHVMKR